MIKNIKQAFTLSEVLLVVAIIGIVAAVTIPNLSNGVNEDKNIMLYRNSVDQINAAYGKALSEYGGSIQGLMKVDCTKSGINDGGYCIGEKLVKYINFNKDCKDTTGECFTNGKIPSIGCSMETDSATCDYSFILKNGAGVCLYTFEIDIDVDGPAKGPNTWNVDIFRIVLQGYNDAKYLPATFKRTGTDQNFNISYDADKWAYEIGNMDYLRCANSLNWISKKTCD